MKDNEKSKGKKIGSFIMNIILIILVVNIATALFASGKQEYTKPLLGGMRPVVVVSGSMLPEIQINSISIMKYCSIDDLVIGDVVMYNHPRLGINITHRVIEAGTNEHGVKYIKTKGDANKGPDNLDITDEMVVGKLLTTVNWVAPYVSLVMSDNGKVNMVALIPILFILAMILTLIGMAIYNVWVLIYSVYIVIFRQDKQKILVDTYKENNIEQLENIVAIRNINHNSTDTIAMFFAKILLAKDMKTFEEAGKNIKKSQDRLQKLINNQNREK